VNILCDVHISFKVLNFLRDQGLNVKHVNELPDKWNTKDSVISRFCDENDFVILTKDKDFKDSFLLKRKPKKVLKVNLGNISNEQLIQILSDNIVGLQNIGTKPSFLCEISKSGILFQE
jgi:predicted nuclease of predicted toxin-antitoxin system